MQDSSPNASPDALNGWKEIAAWLGRSPRTVQRWERELGLPVRRIPTPEGGSIVYAFRAELEAWRTANASSDIEPADEGARASAVLQADEGATSGDAAAPAPGVEGNRPTPRALRILQYRVPLGAVVVAAGLGILAGALGAGLNQRVAGVPVTVEFEGRSLRAYSEGGRLVWMHEFDRAVSRPLSLERPLASTDLNDDGSPDLVVPVRFAERRTSTKESDAVMAFRADGSVLWSVQPRWSFTWGSETFSGPWYVHDVAVGRSQAGLRTWIAFSHNTWWPGFVVEVTPEGVATLRYVQPGRVYSLAYWNTANGPVLVAGGTLNEASSASAAVLDLAGPPATWHSPATSGVACQDCPSAVVRAMYLLPTSHVTRALTRPYGWVVSAKTVSGGLQLAVNDGFGGGTGTGSGSLVTISDAGDVAAIERSDQYWHMHRELEAQGRLSHAAEACPDLATGLDVRRWRPASGWSTTHLPLRSTFRPAAGPPVS